MSKSSSKLFLKCKPRHLQKTTCVHARIVADVPKAFSVQASAEHLCGSLAGVLNTGLDSSLLRGEILQPVLQQQAQKGDTICQDSQ